MSRAHIDAEARDLLLPLIRIAILSIGFLTAIDQMGFEVRSLLAGLGIAGLAVGLAAQETLANIIAGFSILWDRPFRLGDVVTPTGDTRRLFVQGNIPNHGVLGRAGAAGYLRRVADELTRRGLDRTHAAEAASRMEESSHLFRKLRYEADLRAAGDLLGRIADTELSALDHMERAWPEVRAMR